MAFGDQLGPLFLQVGDNYTPKSFPELKAYLQHLPRAVPVFVEVCHDDRVTRIKGWKEQGLQSVWFFMHQHDERYSLGLCDYVVEELTKALGLKLYRPQFIVREKGMLD